MKTSKSYIAVGTENSTSVDLFYEDHGTGKPVVLIHGYPLSGRSFEKQIPALLGAGRRVITYDRRGFGKSSQPTLGYNYDTFAEDLHKVLTTLDLKEVTLVGFSMGGGEVARYLGVYGDERVEKAVFLSSVPPFLLKTPGNPAGVDGSVFEGIQQSILADRFAFLTGFFSNFYNLDVFLGKRVSSQVVQDNWNIAASASPQGTFDCVASWLTDFREDVAKIKVPTLIVQGDADRILPITATGIPLHQAIKGSRLVVVEGAPHGLTHTHKDKLNADLLAFLKS